MTVTVHDLLLQVKVIIQKDFKVLTEVGIMAMSRDGSGS